nr:MAG TPA: hypothetical protein [Caudoviricetes sp.]
MTPSHPAPLRAPRQNFAPFFSLLNSAYITAPPHGAYDKPFRHILPEATAA